MKEQIDLASGKSMPLEGLERYDFYRQAAQAYAVLVAGETRGYGCFVLKKGVLIADAPATTN